MTEVRISFAEATPGVIRASALRSVSAAIAGNTLEVYDFLCYSFFAVTIGKQFFPASDALTSLLLSVGTFGVGFLARPIGAVVIGAYADRVGRKPAMTLTISLMALSTAVLACAPTYDMIGLFAPVIVVAARLMQGFSAGGEMGTATSFIIETAPSDRRGLYASWMNASQGIALILAGAIGLGLSTMLSPQTFETWGWRAAFLVRLLIAPVGFYIRNQLPESFEPRHARENASSKLGIVCRHHGRLVVLGILTIMSGAVSFYVVSYLTTYAIATLKLPTSISLAAPFVSGVTALLGSILGGILADRFGRRIVMILPRIALIFVALPSFLLLSRYPAPETLFLASAGLMALQSISGAVMSVLLPEALPASVRTTGFSLIYTVGVTLFGGPTQLILTWLIGVTGDPVSPAYYLMAANFISVIAMIFLSETRGKPLS